MSDTGVLIVEDEPDIAELIRFHIDREGLPARVVQSGRVALEAVQRQRPDLVVLDLMLPDLDGLEVCRQLKWDRSTRDIPILIVSAKGEETDIVTGLELGADDYVTKPFSPKVLMARMRSILRRSANGSSRTVEDVKRISVAGGALVVDVDRHTITAGGQPVELTRTEFGILHCLAVCPGFVRTRDQIIASVHGHSAVLTRRTVDVHVTSIRRKLGELADVIQTVRGVGYRLVEPERGDGE